MSCIHVTAIKALADIASRVSDDKDVEVCEAAGAGDRLEGCGGHGRVSRRAADAVRVGPNEENLGKVPGQAATAGGLGRTSGARSRERLAAGTCALDMCQWHVPALCSPQGDTQSSRLRHYLALTYF